MWWQCLLVCSFVASGCSNGSSKDAEAPQPQRASEDDAGSIAVPPVEKRAGLPNFASVDKIVYRFHDASVPPPHHRSFTITATPGQISKKVDSYGDVVSESANAITAEQFEALRAMLGTMSVSEAERDAREAACTGGTGNSLRVYIGEQEVFNRHLDACGAAPVSELHGQVKALGRAAGALLVSGAGPAGLVSEPTP